MHAIASVVSESLRPHGLQPAMVLCPWDSPGKNTGVGCHALLQRILLTQGSNQHFLSLLHWQVGYLLLASKQREHQVHPVPSISSFQFLTSMTEEPMRWYATIAGVMKCHVWVTYRKNLLGPEEGQWERLLTLIRAEQCPMSHLLKNFRLEFFVGESEGIRSSRSPIAFRNWIWNRVMGWGKTKTALNIDLLLSHVIFYQEGSPC